MVKKTERLADLAGEPEPHPEDMLMVRLVATFSAAMRLSGKKMSTVDDAAADTIKLAKKLEKHILEG